MSRRLGRTWVFEAEPPGTCELCGAYDELRPYGPNGERICPTCGEKDIETTVRQMERLMSGTDDSVLMHRPVSTENDATGERPRDRHKD
jgi:hypothetical protein